MTPRLWGRASSVNVQKVMWALEECDIAHERIDAGGKYGHVDTPEFAELNPTRRVPVWQEDDLTVWESHAILRHLARGPAESLWPKSRADQARADQWIEFTTTTILPPLIGAFFQTVRLPQAERSAAKLAHHVSSLDAALDILNGHLAKRNWIAGEALSIGDIAAGSSMYRYFTMEIPRPDRVALANWYTRLTERSAYRATVMTSYEELRGT